jgi:anti-sigma B factor antagonist
LSVGGEVDLSNAAQLTDAIGGASDDGTPKVVLDLADVTFMDSTGLGALVTSLRKIKEKQGTLVLAAIPQQVERLLDITGLSEAFVTSETVDDAVAG